MHTLIADRPESKSFAKQRVDAKEALDRNLADAKRAQDAYAAASLKAFETGGTIPEAPQPARVFDEAYRQINARINMAEATWIGEHAEEFRAELLGREDDLVAEAAALVAKLDALVDEAAVIRASLAEVHRHDPSNPGVGMPASAGTSLELLVDCARHDLRMCQPPFAQARTLIGASR